MAKNRAQREKELQRLKTKKARQSMERMQSLGPYVKQIIQARGLPVLPFYEFIDSYEEAFKGIVADAMRMHSSLLAVHEVGNDAYYKTDWAELGYPGYEHVPYQTDEDLEGYGTGDEENDSSNLSGAMGTLRAPDGSLRTIVLIRRDIDTGTANTREMRYVFKCAALLHEIGHVDDFEKELNFNPLNVIEAEVYANLQCFDGLAKLHMWQAFDMVEQALRKATNAPGWRGVVAQRVLERRPEYKPYDWLKNFDWTPTAEELKLIGPKGIAAFTANRKV